jgi:hypothetical protein
MLCQEASGTMTGWSETISPLSAAFLSVSSLHDMTYIECLAALTKAERAEKQVKTCHFGSFEMALLAAMSVTTVGYG